MTDKPWEQSQYKISSFGANFSLSSLENKARNNREFVCGFGAAFLNISCTFPLNKAMFRQQLYGVSSWQAIRQLRREGVRYLYRGLLPPLLQKSTSMSLMFGVYHKLQQNFNNQFPSVPRAANHAMAALLAGTVEASLAPFERVQTLLQDKHKMKEFTNTVQAFRELRPHGIGEYYRGLSAVLLRNGPSNILFFLGRDQVKLLLPEAKTDSETLLADFVGGAVLGALISTLFFPVNVVKTRMQSKLGGSFESFPRAFWTIMAERQYSVRNLYRGVHINYVRSIISWGIVNATYEFLMRVLFKES